MFRHLVEFGGLIVGLPMVISLGLVATALPGFAHPTDRELLDALEEHQQCEAEVAVADRLDPVRLGMAEADLRNVTKGLLRDPLQGDSDRRANQGLARFARDATGELSGLEYELWRDQVYRIRWRLSASFERPVMNEFNRRGRICFGAPLYDQTFEAEPGSSKATLRRVVWLHGDRRIELRQLHPLRGGAVYLTVTIGSVLRELGGLGLTAFPDPDRSASWWRRPTKTLQPASEEERKRLGRAFAKVLSQLDH